MAIKRLVGVALAMLIVLLGMGIVLLAFELTSRGNGADEPVLAAPSATMVEDVADVAPSATSTVDTVTPPIGDTTPFGGESFGAVDTTPLPVLANDFVLCGLSVVGLNDEVAAFEDCLDRATDDRCTIGLSLSEPCRRQLVAEFEDWVGTPQADLYMTSRTIEVTPLLVSLANRSGPDGVDEILNCRARFIDDPDAVENCVARYLVTSCADQADLAEECRSRILAGIEQWTGTPEGSRQFNEWYDDLVLLRHPNALAIEADGLPPRIDPGQVTGDRPGEIAFVDAAVLAVPPFAEQSRTAVAEMGYGLCSEMNGLTTDQAATRFLDRLGEQTTFTYEDVFMLMELADQLLCVDIPSN